MDALEYLRRQEFLRDIAPLLLMPLGALMVYVGLLAGMMCTARLPITDYCVAHDLAIPGYGIAFVGGCVALLGLGWFLSKGGEDAPPREPPLRIADPVLSDRVDRASRLTFVGLIALGLAVAEAFPIYSLALQSMAGSHATFDPVWFAADLALFAVADLMVLFVVYQWTESQ